MYLKYGKYHFKHETKYKFSNFYIQNFYLAMWLAVKFDKSSKCQLWFATTGATNKTLIKNVTIIH